ncbi:MAG: competence protein ComEC [Gammaproteobacteria bacterium]
MTARTLAFTLGAWFTHQLAELPDALYLGLAPLLLLIVVQRTAGALGACFLLGIAWCALHGQMALERRLPAQGQQADVVVDGRIVALAGADEKQMRFSIAPEQITSPPITGDRLKNWHWSRCRISVSWYRPDGHTRPQAGERWRVALRLRQPRGLRNAGGFDSEHRAMRERRCATAYVRGDSVPMQLDRSHWSLNRWRELIAQRIRTHLRNSEVSGVIVALAVGIRHDISAQHRQILQHTGTAHLMAISGLHIGLVAGFGLLLGGLCIRAVPRALYIVPASHWGAAAAFAFAAVYAALAGFSIPTQRAMLMLCVFLIAALSGRKLPHSHALAMALFIVLLIDPMAVNDAGTWLSFAAVAGLMWAITPNVPAPHATLGSAETRLGDWPRRAALQIRLAVRVQCAASLVMLPLALACFAYQSLLSPIANLFAVPVTGLLVVPLTLLAVVIDPLLPELAGAALRAAALLMQWVFVLLAALKDLGWLYTPPRAPSALVLLGALIGVTVLLSPVGLRLRLIGLFWLAPLIVPPTSAPPERGLDLHVLDVGQGLSVVLRTRQHTLLFDAGPSWSRGNDAGASVVVPMLRRQGISRLDRILISHRHLDHAGGLVGVLRALPGTDVLGDHGFDAFVDKPCRAGLRWTWDGYEFQILHPPAASALSSGSISTTVRARSARLAVNDRSCVLRVTGPGGSVLLPGDIEKRGEFALIQTASSALRSDVLLVPHHGSRTSSTLAFLQSVRPDLAINSSGHRNRFSLPAADVVARYRASGIELVDTACVGGITLRLRAGQRPILSHWRQSQLRFWHARETGAHCVNSDAERTAGMKKTGSYRHGH